MPHQWEWRSCQRGMSSFISLFSPLEFTVYKAFNVLSLMSLYIAGWHWIISRTGKIEEVIILCQHWTWWTAMLFLCTDAIPSLSITISASLPKWNNTCFFKSTHLNDYPVHPVLVLCTSPHKLILPICKMQLKDKCCAEPEHENADLHKVCKSAVTSIWYLYDVKLQLQKGNNACQNSWFLHLLLTAD